MKTLSNNEMVNISAGAGKNSCLVIYSSAILFGVCGGALALSMGVVTGGFSVAVWVAGAASSMSGIYSCMA